MKNRFIALLQVALVALLAAGCEGQKPDNGGEQDALIEGKISLLVNNDIIRANGEDAALFTVLVEDAQGRIQDVTANSEIYVDGSETPLAEPTYSSSASGEWVFYALYGFEVSNELSVRAVEGIVELPADVAPSSTDFHHRVLLVQHTGTGCSMCPGMMSNLKKLAENDSYNTRYHHVASHSYNTKSEGDDAYSKAANTLSREILKVSQYPWLTFNLTTTYAHELESIQTHIDLLYQKTANVGVAATAALIGEEVFANVAVKAGVAGNYRVAVWLLEDNINSPQTSATASWMNIHNNALREMAGESKLNRVYGRSIGSLEVGESTEMIASMALESDWMAENCEVLVIVTTEDAATGDFKVVNCTVCPVGGAVSYEYNN